MANDYLEIGNMIVSNNMSCVGIVVQKCENSYNVMVFWLTHCATNLSQRPTAGFLSLYAWNANLPTGVKWTLIR